VSELNALTLKSALDGLAARRFSAEELARAQVDAIEAANPQLNAFVLTTPEKAIEMAKASDVRRARGEAGWKAPRSGSRTSSPPKACAPPPPPRSSAISCRPTSPP
jgi:hypothetical protein